MSEDGHAPWSPTTRAVAGAVVAGGAVWGGACTFVVLVRPHGVLFNAALAIAVALGFALIALWVCVVLRIGYGDGPDGDDWRKPAPDPPKPHPPSEGPDLWPELEREIRAYLAERERTPVPG